MEELNDKVKENNDELKFPLAIQSLLKDGSMSDVELVGDDGVRIQAHKLILAARSAVFKSLLCGHFSEANTSVVKINNSGKVIECLIEYCYTDKLSPSTLPKDDDQKMIDVLVELAFASDYFAFPSLCRQVKKSVVQILSQNPSMASQVLTDFPNLLDGKAKDEVLNVVQKFLAENPSSSWKILAALSEQDLDGKLGKAALDVVRPKFQVDMVPPNLSAKAMEMVVSDKAFQGREIDFFRLIQTWVHSSNKKDDNNDDIGPSKAKRAKTIQSVDDKFSVAKSLIEKHIQLDNIKPSDFENIVEPSGLVSKDVILATYKNLARNLEERHGEMFDIFRGVGWGSNGETVYEHTQQKPCTELLRCVAFHAPGVYKWSVMLLDCQDEEFETGVVAISSDVNRDTWLGSQKYGWSYHCNGSTYHDDREEKTTGTEYGGIKKKIIITFTLDLTERGSLKAHFHDRQVPLFDNMLMDGKTKVADRAFVPAVSFDGPGKVGFLGFS